MNKAEEKGQRGGERRGKNKLEEMFGKPFHP